MLQACDMLYCWHQGLCIHLLAGKLVYLSSIISHITGNSDICVCAAGKHGSAVDMESGGSDDTP